MTQTDTDKYDVRNNAHGKCDINSTLPVTNQSEIFISYSWGGKSEEMAHQIYNTFSKMG